MFFGSADRWSPRVKLARIAVNKAHAKMIAAEQEYERAKVLLDRLEEQESR